ncbi:MAG: hypothetical protein CMQ43_05790 [Gammaproteobacteria bacterium]|mgnify:CR=1 FL=1|nr:hypothetical protein [Gammaproteobacteria bacterium]|tara:strand:+ start:2525 stop:3175 length:651 start_codon:yes stop_codon:yes gene_type:complete
MGRLLIILIDPVAILIPVTELVPNLIRIFVPQTLLVPQPVLIRVLISQPIPILVPELVTIPRGRDILQGHAALPGTGLHLFTMLGHEPESFLLAGHCPELLPIAQPFLLGHHFRAVDRLVLMYAIAVSILVTISILVTVPIHGPVHRPVHGSVTILAAVPVDLGLANRRRLTRAPTGARARCRMDGRSACGQGCHRQPDNDVAHDDLPVGGSSGPP